MERETLKGKAVEIDFKTEDFKYSQLYSAQVKQKLTLSIKQNPIYSA